jgi:hypothetical protein
VQQQHATKQTAAAPSTSKSGQQQPSELKQLEAEDGITHYTTGKSVFSGSSPFF